jgi:hypothetical protein
VWYPAKVLGISYNMFAPFTIQSARLYSDQSLVVCSLSLAVESPSAVERLVRGWRRVDRNVLRGMLEDSELSKPSPKDVEMTSWFRRRKPYYGVWPIDWRRRMPYVDSQVV